MFWVKGERQYPSITRFEDEALKDDKIERGMMTKREMIGRSWMDEERGGGRRTRKNKNKKKKMSGSTLTLIGVFP